MKDTKTHTATIGSRVSPTCVTASRTATTANIAFIVVVLRLHNLM